MADRHTIRRLVSVSSAKQLLHQGFISQLAAPEPNHVALVKDDQTHIVENCRILTHREVELLRRRDDDFRTGESFLYRRLWLPPHRTKR